MIVTGDIYGQGYRIDLRHSYKEGYWDVVSYVTWRILLSNEAVCRKAVIYV